MPDPFDGLTFEGGYGATLAAVAVPAPAPSVDPGRDYVPGGHGYTPLVGQYLLGRHVDDLSADLGYEVYRVMEQDATVHAAVSVLVGGVLSGPLQVQANHRHRVEAGEDLDADPGRKARIEESQRWVDFVKRNFLRLREGVDVVTRANLKAIRRGNMAQEITCEPGQGEDAGRVMLKSIRALPPWAWAFVVDGASRPVAIRASTIGSAGYVDLPLDKFALAAFDPEDGDPRGRSILRPAYNGWNLKVNTWPKYLKFLHTAANPTPVAKYDPTLPDEVIDGQYVRQADVLAMQLERGIGGSFFVVPIGTEIEYVQPTTNGEAFLKAMELFKTEIIEGIINAARAIKEAKFGSKADSDGAMDVVGDLIHGLKTWECRVWDSLAYRLVLWNSDKATADEFAPECSRGDVSASERSAMMASLAQLGYALDPAQFPWADGQVGAPIRSTSQIKAQQQEKAMMDRAAQEAQIAALSAKGAPKDAAADPEQPDPGAGPEAEAKPDPEPAD